MSGIDDNLNDCARSIALSSYGYAVTGMIYERYFYNQIPYDSYDAFIWFINRHISHSIPYYWPVQKNPYPIEWFFQVGLNNDEDDDCIYIDEDNNSGNYHASIITRRNAGLAYIQENSFDLIEEYDSSEFNIINCIQNYNQGFLLTGNYYSNDKNDYNGIVRLLNKSYEIINSSSIPYITLHKSLSSNINKFIETYDNKYIAVGRVNDSCWYGEFEIINDQINWIWSKVVDQGELFSIVEDVEPGDLNYLIAGISDDGPIVYRVDIYGNLIEYYEYGYFLGNDFIIQDIVLIEPGGYFILTGKNDNNTILLPFKKFRENV